MFTFNSPHKEFMRYSEAQYTALGRYMMAPSTVLPASSVAAKTQACRVSTMPSAAVNTSFVSTDVEVWSPGKDVYFEARAQKDLGAVFQSPAMRHARDLYMHHDIS
eukprot:3278596-Amphidinium_carterae.2